MKALTLVVLLALGCAHAPLDTVEIDEKAIDARNRVNELAQSLGELATPIMMFCGLVGDEDAKCEGLRFAYDAGRAAVITTQRYIDAFAKTGQGLAIVEAGVAVIEAAVQEVRAETERALEEVRQHVASNGDAAASDSGGSGQSDPEAVGAGSAAETATEGEGSAAAIEQHDAEGQGTNAQAEGAGSAGERAPARGADSSGKEGQ